MGLRPRLAILALRPGSTPAKRTSCLWESPSRFGAKLQGFGRLLKATAAFSGPAAVSRGFGPALFGSWAASPGLGVSGQLWPPAGSGPNFQLAQPLSASEALLRKGEARAIDGSNRAGIAFRTLRGRLGQRRHISWGSFRE